jgi:DNA-directed RNA polymerase specialized sigma24 family protein
VAAVVIDGDALELRMPAGDERDLGEVAGRHRHLSARRTRLRFGWTDAGDTWQEALLRVLADLVPGRAAA